MSKNFFIKRIILILLFPLGLIMFNTAPNATGFIEKIYSNGLFKLFAQALSFITGLFPFSLAEIGLYLLVVAVPAFIIFNIYLIIRTKRSKLQQFFRFVLNAAAIASVVYFCLVFFWSLNYSRLPFADIAKLKVAKATVKDLAEVCDNLIQKANEQRKYVTVNKEGVMNLENGYKDSLKRAYKGYEKASQIFPEFKGKYGNPKGVLLSRYMSYTGISGVYCPFTAEANVDIDMPDMLIPSTTCHEMAHQRGFAREDEANYISYLTCNMHPDADFRYSGTILALIHSMNALYAYDSDTFTNLYKNYSEGLVRDMRANNQYWKRFEGPVEKATDSLNDAYLKANMQKDGVQSYGRMVDLLIAEYKKEKSKQ
jgi:hypothetical protein